MADLPANAYTSADADDTTDPLAIRTRGSVAPQTVSEAPEHARAWERARKTPRARPVYRSGPVETRRLEPEAWKVALALADGDARRIEIHDDSTFTVHNERVK